MSIDTIYIATIAFSCLVIGVAVYTAYTAKKRLKNLNLEIQAKQKRAEAAEAELASLKELLKSTSIYFRSPRG